MSTPRRGGGLHNSNIEYSLRNAPPPHSPSQRQQIHEIAPHRYVSHTPTSRSTVNHSHRLSGSSSSNSLARTNLSQSYDSFDKLPSKKPNYFSPGNPTSRMSNAHPSASSSYSRHGSPTSRSPSWINQTILDDAAWMSEKIYNLQKNGFFRYPAVSKSSDRDGTPYSSQPVTPHSDVYSARTPWLSDESSDHNFTAQDEYSETVRNDEFLSAFKLSEISLTGDDDLLSDISPPVESNTSMKTQTNSSSTLNITPASPTFTCTGDANRFFTSLNKQENSLKPSSDECSSTNLVHSDLLSRLEALQYRAGLTDHESNPSDTNHDSNKHCKTSHVVDTTQSNLTVLDDLGNQKVMHYTVPMKFATDSLSHNIESEVSQHMSTESYRTLNDGDVQGNLNLHSLSRIKNRAEYYLPLSSEEVESILNTEARSHRKFPSPNKKANSRLSPRATISPSRLQPRSQMLPSQEEMRAHTKYDRTMMTHTQFSSVSSKNRRDSIHGVNVMKPSGASSVKSPHSPHEIYLPTPDYCTRSRGQLNRTRASPFSPGSTRNRELNHQTLKKSSHIVQSQDCTNASYSQIGSGYTESESKSEHEEENSWISDENVESFLSSHTFSTKEDFPLNISMHEILHVDHSLNLIHFSKDRKLLTTADQKSAGSEDNRINNHLTGCFEVRASERLTTCHQDESHEKTLQNDCHVRNKIITPVVNPANLVKCGTDLGPGQNPEGNNHYFSSQNTALTSGAKEMRELVQASTFDSAIVRSMIHSRDLLMEEECFDVKIRPQIVRSLSFGEEGSKTSSKSEDENLEAASQLNSVNNETLCNKHFEGNRMLDELKTHDSVLVGFDNIHRTTENEEVSASRIQESVESNSHYSGIKLLEDRRNSTNDACNLSSLSSEIVQSRRIEPSKGFTVDEDVLVDHDSINKTETQQNAKDNISLTSSLPMHLGGNKSTYLEVGTSFHKEILQTDEGLEQKSSTINTWAPNNSLLIEQTQLALNKFSVNNEPYHSSFLHEEPTNSTSLEKHTTNVKQKSSETILSIYKNPLWMDETGTEFDDSVQLSEAQIMLKLSDGNEKESLALDKHKMSLPKRSLDNIWSTYEGVAGLLGHATDSPTHETDSYNGEGSAMMKIRKIDEEIQDLSLSILRSSASKRLIQKAASNEDPAQGKKHTGSEDLDNPVNAVSLQSSATIEVNVKGQIKEIVLSCLDRNLSSKSLGEKSNSVSGSFHCHKTSDGSVLSTDQPINSELEANTNAVSHENNRRMTTHLDQVNTEMLVFRERTDACAQVLRSGEVIDKNIDIMPSCSFPPQSMHCISSDISNQVCQAGNPVDVDEIREEVKQVTFIFSESKGTKEITQNLELPSSLQDGHADSTSSNWVCTFFSNARKLGCNCEQKTHDTTPQEDTTKLNKIEKRVEKLEAEVTKFKQENSNLQKLLKENEKTAAWFASEKEKFQVFVVQKDQQIGDLQRIIADLSNNMKDLRSKVEPNSRREIPNAEIRVNEDQMQEKGGQGNHMDQEPLKKVSIKNKSQLTKRQSGLKGSPGHLQMKTR